MEVNFKMNTYPCNQIRENILLDEDCDLSDVEDEVFIRDGKNNYKLADEINVKKPLMPLRKNKANTLPKIQRKLKRNYKELWKPCCQFLAALCILLGLIGLVIVIVAIFPLPLDRLHHWIVNSFISNNTNSSLTDSSIKLPCSTIKVTNVWTTTLPRIRTECPIRTVDINNDGIRDVIFGFSSGNYSDVLPSDIYCPVFMNTEPPCDGGLIALNGQSGEILWKRWLNDSIYFIECNINHDSNSSISCVTLGTSGTVAVINPLNGSLEWRHNYDNFDIITGGYINDVNGDNVSDILLSKTEQINGDGYLILLSGINGQLLKQVILPKNQKSYVMPELVKIQDVFSILYGTGGISTTGNLSTITLKDFMDWDVNQKNEISKIKNLYENKYGGILIQPIMVDITGDNKLDIIIALQNATIVALNGQSFKQIWNFTVKNSRSNMVPIPAYFNYDNISDFLIIYKTYDDILKYDYMQVYILNGVNGKPFYEKPITHREVQQFGGLTLQSEAFGFDMFLFWTAECVPKHLLENSTNKDKVFIESCPEDNNKGLIMKLNSLSQFDQPPGIEILNSINLTILENSDEKSAAEKVEKFVKNDSRKYNLYDNENFNNRKIFQPQTQNEDDPYEERDSILKDYNNGDMFGNFHNNNKKDNFYNKDALQETEIKTRESILKPNLSNNWPKHSTEEIYHYPNTKRAKNRLLHDLTSSPEKILTETYYKDLKNKLRNSRFEQRDINSHINRRRENQDIDNFIKKDKELTKNLSFNLWNLESEMEKNDVQKDSDNIIKRDVIKKQKQNIKLFVTTGEIIDSFGNMSNSIDIVSLIYWQPINNALEIDENKLSKCIQMKMDKAIDDISVERLEEKKYFTEECLKKFQNKEQAQNLEKLNIGQMKVFRLRLECQCKITKPNQKCPKFLDKEKQSWSSYLGSQNNGVFMSAQN